MPVGFDGLHLAAHAIRSGRGDLVRQEAEFLSRVGGSLRELGVRADEHDLTLRLYLCTIAARYVDAMTHSATPALQRRTTWVLSLLGRLAEQAADPTSPSRRSSMTVRTAVPHRVKVAGRRASVRIGSVTATRRQLPSFIVVGAQRAGTTSLFRALMSHPLIHSANYYKGVNYFDVNYYRDFSWYQGHFPTTSYLRSRSRSVPGEPITFEASGYYLFHPGAAERMARHLPEVRILAMLRDPVERAFSAYKHELARGFETESFERALDLEDERLHGQGDRMLADHRYRSFSHRHHGYVRRGPVRRAARPHASLLPRGPDPRPRQRVVLRAARDDVRRACWTSWDCPRCCPTSFDRWNARPSSPMAESTRARLREHFAEPRPRAGRDARTGPRMAVVTCRELRRATGPPLAPPLAGRGCPCCRTTRGSSDGTGSLLALLVGAGLVARHHAGRASSRRTSRRPPRSCWSRCRCTSRPRPAA